MATSRQEELVKKLEPIMFYCIMAGGRIEIPTTPKTELPMTISNCLLSINIITKRYIPDAAETPNPPLVIAMQNSLTIILLDSGQRPEKVFPGFANNIYFQKY